ncbi:MAG: glycosyltransferase family 4 protein [Candidatus Komeilibacteria bacterium]|nr:glycosyltransferase family 4 protein [Candidatus Komeilibacteria bacterium]
MKILLVTMEYPPFKGGVGNYYFNLVKNLTGHQVKVFQAGPASFYKFFWPKWLKLYFEIKKNVKKDKPDLIWVGQVLPVGEAAYLIKKFYNIHYFASTHGLDIMLPQQQLRKEKAMRQVLDNAEFITANSNFTKKELLNLGYAEDKVEVVYPCSNILMNREINEAKKQIIRNKLNLNNKKVLLTVGRLVERKGQGTVIGTLPKLLEKFPDLVYVMVGDGPDNAKLKALVFKLGLADKVFFLENISNEELPAYYQVADLFVMPAKNLAGDVEGFGIVYLEAAACGLPAVAGKSGGVMEAVVDGQTGLLVDPDNQEELAEKISELLINRELYKKLANNARSRVERDFIWAKQADKLISKLNLWRKTKK